MDEVIGSQQQCHVSPSSDVCDKDGLPKDKRNGTNARQQRLSSGDQEAKMQMEVDQVIQDLAMLRQMAGGGTSNNKTDDNSSQKVIYFMVVCIK